MALGPTKNPNRQVEGQGEEALNSHPMTTAKLKLQVEPGSVISIHFEMPLFSLTAHSIECSLSRD